MSCLSTMRRNFWNLYCILKLFCQSVIWLPVFQFWKKNLKFEIYIIYNVYFQKITVRLWFSGTELALMCSTAAPSSGALLSLTTWVHHRSFLPLCDKTFWRLKSCCFSHTQQNSSFLRADTSYRIPISESIPLCHMGSELASLQAEQGWIAGLSWASRFYPPSACS